jgi:MATE family multidrug resistance protein
LNNFSQVFLTMMSFAFCGHIGHIEYSAAVLATTFINIAGFSIIVGLSTAAETLFPQVSTFFVFSE